MNDPAILFVKPKAITAKDKKALQGAGVIVVEVDDPQSVKLTRAHAEIEGSDLLMAAVEAIKVSGLASVKEKFVELIFNALRARPQQ